MHLREAAETSRRALKDANFAQPASGLFLDRNSLYAADSKVCNQIYRSQEAGTAETVAGSGLLLRLCGQDSPARGLLGQHPIGIHGEGGRFLADTYNHAIRKIDLGIRRVETVIKNLRSGYMYTERR